MASDNRRYVFLSPKFLSKQYKSVPVEILENSIFFFGADRSWLFPSSREEMAEARKQTDKYLEFDEDFKSLIQHKEEKKMAFWLLPKKSYAEGSEIVAALSDPVSRENYLPLIAEEKWWNSEFSVKDAKYCTTVKTIVDTIKEGSFDFDAVMELLYQSNPTLVPTLYWTEG